jgi:hypothetical protein
LKFTGYTADQIERIVLWEIGQVAGTTVSYSKFPKWLIRQRLSERQNQFVAVSQCLKRTALIPAVADRKAYRLPENCMDNGVQSVRYYSHHDTYDDLDIKDQKWLDDNFEGWRTTDSSEPDYCYKADSYGNIPMLGIHPSCDSSGTAYTGTSDTGVQIGTTAPGASANISRVTTSAGAGTVITDTSGAFTDTGVVAGMYVRNVTDGSYAYVVSVDTATQITTSTLDGGTDDTWASGDTYEILAGEYMILCSETRADRYIFGYKMGCLGEITIPDHTLVIDYTPYPLSFYWDATVSDSGHVHDTQRPEIPVIYQHGLAMGVVADMLRTFHENSKEFQRAQLYDTIFANAAAEALAIKTKRPFEDKKVQLFPKIRRQR